MAKSIKLRVSDPPTKAVVSETITPNKTVLNDRLDARDILSMFAGGGHTNLQDPEVRKHYLGLSGLVGAPLAQKLSNAAFLYNQRPEVQQLNPEQRVQGFFALNNSDPEVNEYLKRSAGMGYGALHGFRNSPLLGNMYLTGRQTRSDDKGSNAAAEKIKLIVKNKTK